MKQTPNISWRLYIARASTWQNPADCDAQTILLGIEGGKRIEGRVELLRVSASYCTFPSRHALTALDQIQR